MSLVKITILHVEYKFFFLKPILVTRGNTGKVYSPIKMLIYVQQTFIDEKILANPHTQN